MNLSEKCGEMAEERERASKCVLKQNALFHPMFLRDREQKNRVFCILLKVRTRTLINWL